jgi:hypothetical protein
MARNDSPRHPPSEGRDHTEDPARKPGNAERDAGRGLIAEPGKTPDTTEGGRETSEEPGHHGRPKRLRLM